MTTLSIFQIDVFTDRLFGGNPAAVVPMRAWLPDATLQAIAAENNLSETAFFVHASDDDADHDFHLRWFTPKIEIDLCGHATIAAAHVLHAHLRERRTPLRFLTRSGIVSVTQGREDDELSLNFPAMAHEAVDVTESLRAALGAEPQALFATPVDGVGHGHRMAVFAQQRDVEALRPDFKALDAATAGYLIATAPGDDAGVDYICRFFAPRAGIDEDPATGSIQCMLAPYWSNRLGRSALNARQLSRRGGAFHCENRSGRVLITGKVVTYLTGEIRVTP